MYMFGVAQALKECNLHENGNQTIHAFCTKKFKYLTHIIATAVFAGASAGSLVAVALAVNADLHVVKDFIKESAEDCRSNPLVNAFRCREYLIDCFEKNCPMDGNSLVGNRVQTAVTSLPYFKAIRYTNYRDRLHLRNACVASSTATPIAGFPFWMDDELVIDGGLTDFQPLVLGHEKETVTISPFYMFRADISPSEYVPPTWALFPPSPEKLEWLFNLGVKDCYKWIRDNVHIHRDHKVVVTALHKTRAELMQQAVYNTSLSFSKFLLLLILCIIRPIAVLALYVELLLKALVFLLVGLIKLPFFEQSDLRHAAEHLRSFVSPSVFLLYVPLFGKAINTLKSRDDRHRLFTLFKQSFIFRCVIHAL
jgi:hypothetical protein